MRNVDACFLIAVARRAVDESQFPVVRRACVKALANGRHYVVPMGQSMEFRGEMMANGDGWGDGCQVTVSCSECHPDGSMDCVFVRDN